MKRFIHLILSALVATVLIKGCASPMNPTGGPKDTIPPTLINSIPELGTTNYTSQEITLTFSELINASKLQQNLVITPKTDIKYKQIVKKNKLLLTFTSPLDTNTTYNLNFRDGVTDITEKNPAKNLNIAFSTGDSIDSLAVRGKVQDLFTDENNKNYLVGLYRLTDTLDLLKEEPLYFTKTSENGTFSIEYIKKGNYKLLTYNDDNGNFILDPETEPHGFLEDTIQFQEDSLYISTILQNVKPLEFINTRPDGLTQLINYNKPLTSYRFLSAKIISNNAGTNNQSIRLYKPDHLAYEDSTTVILEARDTVQNLVTDTISIAFIENKKKLTPFSIEQKIQPVNKNYSSRTVLTYNRPIIKLDSNSFYYKIDTTYNFPAEAEISTNYNNTQNQINLSLNAKYQDEIKTIVADTSNLYTEENLAFVLYIDSAAIISATGDTTKSILKRIPKQKKGQYGKINFTLQTEEPFYLFQIVSKNGQVVQTIENQKTFQASTLPPDEYSFRVIIDKNNNRKWDPGNLLDNVAPEEIIILTEKSQVRIDWTIDLALSF